MITLPESLRTILLDSYDKNSSIFYNLTNHLIDNANNILNQRNFLTPYFFPEYTDHGIDHIESVLKTSASLIHPETIEALKPIDAYILVGATICHDIAMNLNYEAFEQLITPKRTKSVFSNQQYKTSSSVDTLKLICLLQPNAKTWAEEWQMFIIKQKDDPNLLGPNVNFIPLEKLPKKHEITEIQRQIVGEFIRINHARIAFEIALNGLFDGIRQVFVIPIEKHYDNNTKYLNILIGTVAWSHNFDIQDTFDLLKCKFGGSTYGNPLNSSIIYLMGLLRIADALQVSIDRTGSSYYFNFRSIKNPISKREFERHKKITLIHPINYRSGVLNIHVAIENSEDFHLANTTISLIRKEIIHTKHYIYFFFQNNSKYKLAFDDIESNIYSKSFAQNLDFYPEPINLNISKNLIPFLIAPLYGNEVRIGLRELIQNSLDACMVLPETDNYLPTIHLKIDDTYLTITDNGVGMNLEEIKKYYLTIGSSSKLNSNNNKTKTIGKFGIGALATFLIGDSFEVFTKKFGSKEYLHFRIDKSNSFNKNQISLNGNKSINFDVNERIQINKINAKSNKIIASQIKKSGTIVKIKHDIKKIDTLKKLSDFIWTVNTNVDIFLNDVLLNDFIIKQKIPKYLKGTTYSIAFPTITPEIKMSNSQPREILINGKPIDTASPISANLIINDFIVNKEVDLRTPPILKYYFYLPSEDSSLATFERHRDINNLLEDNINEINIYALNIIDKSQRFPLLLNRKGIDEENLNLDELNDLFHLFCYENWKTYIEKLKSPFTDFCSLPYEKGNLNIGTKVFNPIFVFTSKGLNVHFGDLNLLGKVIVINKSPSNCTYKFLNDFLYVFNSTNNDRFQQLYSSVSNKRKNLFFFKEFEKKIREKFTSNELTDLFNEYENASKRKSGKNKSKEDKREKIAPKIFDRIKTLTIENESRTICVNFDFQNETQTNTTIIQLFFDKIRLSKLELKLNRLKEKIRQEENTIKKNNSKVTQNETNVISQSASELKLFELERQKCSTNIDKNSLIISQKNDIEYCEIDSLNFEFSKNNYGNYLISTILKYKQIDNHWSVSPIDEENKFISIPFFLH